VNYAGKRQRANDLADWFYLQQSFFRRKMAFKMRRKMFPIFDVVVMLQN